MIWVGSWKLDVRTTTRAGSLRADRPFSVFGAPALISHARRGFGGGGRIAQIIVPERFQMLILLSPVSSFVVAYQQLFFYREWPDATVWLVASAEALGAFVIGALLFLAFEDGFTEQL